MKKQRTHQAIVKKSVGAIHIEAKLSLVERKLSNALLFNAYENLLLNKQHSIDIKTMSALIGFESKNTSELKVAIEKLVSTTIKWNIFDEKGEEEWEISSLLAYAKIKNGICTYEYSSALAEKFYNPEIYARINLSIQKNIASGHTLALYEMCVRFLGVGSTGWISVEKFRRVMGAVSRMKCNTEFCTFTDKDFLWGFEAQDCPWPCVEAMGYSIKVFSGING